jgi:uroporphyrinogen decarboxylase
MVAPNFNRIKKALLLDGEPDRVPLAEVYVDPYIKERFIGRPIKDLQDHVEFYYRAGYDFVELRQGFGILMGSNYGHQQGSGHVSFTRVSDAAGVRHKRVWAEQHRGLITDQQSLTRYGWPCIDDFSFEAFDQIKAILPSGMKVIAVGGKIFSPAWELMGFETFCLNTIVNIGLVQRLMEKIATIQMAVFERMAACDMVGAMWLADDLAYASGLMISPDFFRKYLFPYFVEYKKICDKYHLPLIYHSDGNIGEVIEDLIQCGIQAIHPIEPKAMDIVKLKAKYGKRLCLIGNIDVGETLARGTPTKVKAEVAEKIKALAPGGGYCLGSSNAITNYVQLDNYIAMLDAAKDHGRYPIAID